MYSNVNQVFRLDIQHGAKPNIHSQTTDFQSVLIPCNSLDFNIRDFQNFDLILNFRTPTLHQSFIPIIYST